MSPPDSPLALLTDLYELTMAQAYWKEQMFAPATFSLYIRDYPADRGYFVAAGLEAVLDYLESFHFGSEDIDYLASTGTFSQDFLHFLSGVRFRGEVWAMPEGRPFFVDEPILEVTGPIIEAQLVETYVINAVNLGTAIASKAARCVRAARDRKLVDFSLRRTQGADAGMQVARASYLAGFAGTSNVLAGKRYGIPTSGTMAHSFVTSFREEIEAFRSFARAFPDNAVLLIDTYDTVQGAEKAITVAREMCSRGQSLRGVRLDSGDMAELSREVRALLRDAGLGEVSIFASGGFDEFKIDQVLSRGAEIDAFGVGTKMGVSADAPYNDIAYKLVQYDGRPVLKLSTGKRILVDAKQVFRTLRSGRAQGDTIALRGEELEGAPLLERVMSAGKRLWKEPSLAEIRDRCREELATLPAGCRAMREPERYPVGLSQGLDARQRQAVHRVQEKELGES